MLFDHEWRIVKQTMSDMISIIRPTIYLHYYCCDFNVVS